MALRDQLLHYPDDALKRAMARALGDRVDTITVADLLTEIETLAVVKQSNLVNTLALMSAKQERWNQSGSLQHDYVAWLPYVTSLPSTRASSGCPMLISGY